MRARALAVGVVLTLFIGVPTTANSAGVKAAAVVGESTLLNGGENALPSAYPEIAEFVQAHGEQGLISAAAPGKSQATLVEEPLDAMEEVLSSEPTMDGLSQSNLADLTLTAEGEGISLTTAIERYGAQAKVIDALTELQSLPGVAGIKILPQGEGWIGFAGAAPEEAIARLATLNHPILVVEHLGFAADDVAAAQGQAETLARQGWGTVSSSVIPGEKEILLVVQDPVRSLTLPSAIELNGVSFPLRVVIGDKPEPAVSKNTAPIGLSLHRQIDYAMTSGALTLRAGGHIWPRDNWLATAGFVMTRRSDFKKGIATAGHAYVPHLQLSYFGRGPNYLQSTPLYWVTHINVGGPEDWGIMQKSSLTTTVSYSSMFYRGLGPLGTPSAAYMQYAVVQGQVAQAPIGSEVYFYGIKSARAERGRIARFMTHKGEAGNALVGGNAAAGGDSGAPVWVTGTDGRTRAAGIVQAQGSRAAECSELFSACWYFVPMKWPNKGGWYVY